MSADDLDHDDRMLALEADAIALAVRVELLEADLDRLAERVDQIERRRRRWFR